MSVVPEPSSSMDRSTWPSSSHSTADADHTPQPQPRGDFMEAMPAIRRKLEQELEALSSPDQAKAWVNRCLDYTLQGGKMHRGKMVPTIVKQLSKGRSAEETQLLTEQAITVGWAIEVLQAAFLTIDDIMDGSSTRRGRPCYYTLVGDGAAINDGLILESLVFRLLRTELKRANPQYADISELFRDVILVTEVGQLLDATTTSATTGPVTADKLDETFTSDHYAKIVQFKTADYSFYLPVASALLLSGVTCEAVLGQSQEVCRRIGEYFQVQDDFLDCYGDPEVTGKVGTDIAEQKCTWLAVTALERLHASPEHATLLSAFVDPDVDRRVRRVEHMYAQLDMRSLYAEYERDTREGIMHDIEGLVKAATVAGADTERNLYETMGAVVHSLMSRKK